MSESQQTLALKVATKRGVTAAQACADAATKIDPTWMEKAYNAFVIFARLQFGRNFTTEDARRALVAVPEAPDARAWGAVALRAKRAGLITSVGYQPVESSNGSPKTLWRAVV